MQIEEESTLLLIDELQNHGINASDIAKLRTAGLFTIKGISMTSKRHLCRIKGLSEVKVDKIKEILQTKYKIDFCSAKTFLKKRELVEKISTGSSDFDLLLNGGIQTMAITEVFGEFRTGKTQLATTLCVTVQLNENKKAVYIDTEGTFRPERVSEIAVRFNLDPDKILDNIIMARAFNVEQQIDLLNKLQLIFSEEPNIYKLIVIDSVMNLFRTDYTGRGELGERQSKLNVYLSKLIRMADEHNLAIFITNQVMSDPGSTMTFVSDPKKPVGGHVLAHASTTRIYLRKGKGETRVAKIYDSPDVPEAEAVYSITEGGIDNAIE